MPQAKIILIEGYDDQGNLVYDRTIRGKKNRRAHIVEALRTIRPTGGVIREQQQGAKGWATWYMEAGAKEAERGPSVFDDWTVYTKS